MKKKVKSLSEIVKELSLRVECGKNCLERDVGGGYAGDLLSDVMANSAKNDIWVTLQIHPNIVAVAVLRELAGIVVVNGRKPEVETIRKADAEKMPILSTDLPAFELIGKLHELGILGTR